jgi:benzoyl-CoA reductase subunit C
MSATSTSDGLQALVERCDDLLHDVRLGAVRDWKAHEPGRKAVGCMPVWFPREIVHAAGMLPVSLVGGGDDVEIIKGDAYFQSYICHIPRSTVEMALNGCLDPVDGMIFPSICDVIRNLSGMWQMLFPDRPAWYFDMPQSLDDIGASFFAHELGLLRDGLHELSGRPRDDEALAASIALYNENRRLVEALYAGRRETPWHYPTSELYVVLRAGNVLPVEEHNALLREYQERAPEAGRHPIDNARVVVVGSFCEQPPLNLIRTIERAGCYIVDDDLLLGNRMIRGDVVVEGDPLEAVVRAFLERAREAAFLYRPLNKGAELVERLQACHAEGVLFCAPSFCDPALLDQPMLVKAVEAAGVPHTSFKYAENTGQFQVIREQAGTFADSIKLWGAA